MLTIKRICKEKNDAMIQAQNSLNHIFESNAGRDQLIPNLAETISFGLACKSHEHSLVQRQQSLTINPASFIEFRKSLFLKQLQDRKVEGTDNGILETSMQFVLQLMATAIDKSADLINRKGHDFDFRKEHSLASIAAYLLHAIDKDFRWDLSTMAILRGNCLSHSPALGLLMSKLLPLPWVCTMAKVILLLLWT